MLLQMLGCVPTGSIAIWVLCYKLRGWGVGGICLGRLGVSSGAHMFLR